MSFFDWMNMNMVIDIAFVVFSAAIIWKFRKIQKENLDLYKKLGFHKDAIIEMHKNLEILEKDILIVAKNPQAARKTFKDRIESLKVKEES